MKNVWVLEKFMDTEAIEKMIQQTEELLAKCETEEHIEIATKILESHKKTQKENPNGYWTGEEGKSRYKDFCHVAKEYMRRHPDQKLRVVKAEIPEDAEYWLGYQNAVVNDGVMKYLYATYR